MARTTKAEVEATFRALMRTIGGDFNPDNPYDGWEPYAEGRQCKAIVGRYSLDYAACYGGWCIDRKSNAAGGESSITMHGLSAGRMSSARFVESMRFAIDLIESQRR